LRIDASYGAESTAATIVLTYVDSINTKAELVTNLAATGSYSKPIGFLYPIGRGEYYNAIGVRLQNHQTHY